MSDHKILFGLIFGGIIGIIIAGINGAVLAKPNEKNTGKKAIVGIIWIPYYIGMLWYWVSLL